MSVSLIRPRGTSLGVYIPITNYDDGDGDSYSDDDGDDDNEDDNNEDGFWSQLLDLAARSPIFCNLNAGPFDLAKHPPKWWIRHLVHAFPFSGE